MTDKVHKEKLITPIGVGFIELIVPNLMQDAFEAYKKRDFTRRYFQVSVWEHTYSAAAVVLAVLGMEAFRNKIYYHEGKVPKGVPSDISRILMKKLPSFPHQKFQEIITEVFVVRDVIVHNHIYEVNVILSAQNWNMISHRQKLLEGYGDNKKYERSVNRQRRRTKLLELNVQPLKIEFEDLFTILVVLDSFIGVTQKAFGPAYVPFHLFERFNDSWAENLSELLTYYYDQIPNTKFVKQIDRLAKELRKDFGSFLPDRSDFFIANTCPKCSSLGFHKLSSISHCNSCGLKIEVLNFRGANE